MLAELRAYLLALLLLPFEEGPFEEGEQSQY